MNRLGLKGKPAPARFGQEFKQSARARALFGLIMPVSEGSIRLLMMDYADTLNLALCCVFKFRST